MNITQEMIEGVAEQIKNLSEEMAYESLPVRIAMYSEIATLGKLKAAYEYLLELRLEIDLMNWLEDGEVKL